MRIDSMRMAGVTTYRDNTLVAFPSAGIMLVTGANGSGKSSLIEAVSYAIWGKTLRGAPIWRDQKSRWIAISATHRGESLLVERSDRSKVKLAYDRASSLALRHETTTEAQRALVADIGMTHDQWRRACVISSSDAAAFALATDAERKRLVEELWSGQALETAYRAALEGLAAANRDAQTAERQVAVIRERVRATTDRLRDAVEPTLPEPPATVVDGAALASTRSMLAAAEREAADRSRAARRIEADETSHARAKLARAREAADRLHAATCPTCGQSIPASMTCELQAEVERARQEAEIAADSARRKVSDVEADLADLSSEISALRARLETLSDAERAWGAYHREAAAVQALVAARDKATAALAQAEAEVAKAEADAASAAREVATCSAVVSVLSPKGVRAHLLSQFLRSIETLANHWLHQICDGDIQIHLVSKDDDAKGAVTLEVEVGRNRAAAKMLTDDDTASESLTGRRPYPAASGGERRRVDVALTLALSQVAGLALGDQGSTIWCDEIFDALDEEGVRRVAAALADFARTCPVVVIAHNAASAIAPYAASHAHVADQQVTIT